MKSEILQAMAADLGMDRYMAESATQYATEFCIRQWPAG